MEGDPMRRANVHVYIHYVWATWDRLPLITPEIQGKLYGAILDKCKKFGARPLALGGVEDHIHLLVRLPATLSLAELIGEVKGFSAFAITEGKAGRLFKWQGGYGAFSVSEHRLTVVQRYIRNQASHHHPLGTCPQWKIMEADNDEDEQ
jgi:putative transposase